MAPSLGGVETLVTLPAVTSHAGLSAAERHRLGISDSLIRVSVGIENTADLIRLSEIPSPWRSIRMRATCSTGV